MLRTTQRSVTGFTLIEILVVLVIAGLIAGVALPRLVAISQRYEIATQKKRLLSEIGVLGYRAYVTGQARTLTSLPSTLTESDTVNVATGWRIEVSPPIQYAFTGICSGGTVKIISPDGATEAWTLPPPLCKPVLSP